MTDRKLLQRAGQGTVAAGALLAAAAFAQEPCGEWSKEFPYAALTLGGPTVYRAIAEFDDGGGPALYIGGEFDVFAVGGAMKHLAKWNGTVYESLGGVAPSMPVETMCVWDDGTGPALYVGGPFGFIGDMPAKRIARWDGSAWSPVGSGLTGTIVAYVRGMCTFDDGSGEALYVTGTFSKTGDGLPLASVARWDGSEWSSVGAGLPGPYPDAQGRDIVAFDDGAGPTLYVGGYKLNGWGSAPVYRWDGAEWKVLGDLVSGNAYALRVFDDGSGPALWAGGWFPEGRVMRWREGGWSAAGAGISNGLVVCFGVYDAGDGPGLFAGGEFVLEGGERNNFARWNGAAWEDWEGGATESQSEIVAAIAATDDPERGPVLWTSGRHERGLRTWTPAEGWAPVGTGANMNTNACVVFDDGSGPAVYVGGWFDAIGDIKALGLARWDAVRGWSTVGDWADVKGGKGAVIHRLEVLDAGDGPRLHAIGKFKSGGGNEGAAVWDGEHWTRLGQDLSIVRLTVYDSGAGPALHASTSGGYFGKAICRLEQNKWVKWAEGTGGDFVGPMLEFDDGTGNALWVGGSFHTFEGVESVGLVRYRPGEGWSAPPGGGVYVPNSVAILRDFTVFDDGAGPSLYATGFFTKIGGKDIKSLARWDGQTWHQVGGGVEGGKNGVPSIGVVEWDDGSGPALFLAGVFNKVGGKAATRVAKWDGKEWWPVPGLTGGPGTDGLAGGDVGAGPMLFAVGAFYFADNYPSARFAAWIPCAKPCPADLDGDGALTLFDFLAFANAFNAGGAAADCDGSGALDVFDFVCYAEAFNAGC